MRFGSDALKGALAAGTFDVNYTVDVFYDGQRMLKDLPITDVSLTDDATSLIQSTGSFTCTYQGDFAESIAPREVGDVLSPFGSQVPVSALVTCGPALVERVRLGQYEIAEAPSIVTQPWLFNTAFLTKGDIIHVTVKDLFARTDRDRFDVPGAPVNTSSVYGEIQRLTQLPVTRTIPDGPVAASVAYQVEKLQAVYDLANASLDATPYITSDGTISLRPNVWPAVVDTIKGGDDGTLVSVDKAMTNDLVYNKIVVRSYAGDGTAVLASAEITDGKLRTQNRDGSRSPYGRVPTFFSSQYVTTIAQGQNYATTWLPRVSQLRGVQVTLTELFNPLRENGDVVQVQRFASGLVAEEFTGRVVGIQRGMGRTQQTTVAVGS